MKFEIIGEEIRYKEIKSHGTGGVIYVPKSWAGEKVAIIRGVIDEVENISRTIDMNRRVIYSYFVGDLLHRGHIEAMRNAKRMVGPNGISVVGVLTREATLEKKDEPIVSFDERVGLVSAIRYNDVVVAQKTYSPIKNLQKIKPDIAIESDSHNEEDIKKVEKFMESIGGEVRIIPYYPDKSSTKLKELIKNG